MPRRLPALALLGLLIALPFAGLARLLSPSPCRSPVILPVPGSTLPHPIPQFSAIIQQAGGLPRANAEWDGSGPPWTIAVIN
jgi:hypothetical protein